MKGKLITDLFLDAYQLGWDHTFIYEEFNSRPGDGGYGFFNNDGSSSVADASNAVEMGFYTHNLTTILADTSSAFTVGAANPTIAGMPATGYSQLMQKSNGTYELVIWGEAFANGTPTSITVNLGASYPTVNVYDTTLGSTPVQTLSNVSSVPLTLTDHVLIVEFTGP
jgi:hypothetical protein